LLQNQLLDAAEVGENFAQIVQKPESEGQLRSYVSTMKKQGHNVMETIKSVYEGKVLMPSLRC
jgi:hypothetical protein